MQARTSVGRDFQDNLLGRLMEGNQVTTIYLRNRMSLRGRIIRFDPYVVLLDPLDGSPPQMVYKSAVVSISGPRGRPGGPPRGGPGRGPGGPRPFRRDDGDRPRYGPRDEGDRPRFAPRPPEGDRPPQGGSEPR
jgi:RNA chaperone Hfq